MAKQRNPKEPRFKVVFLGDAGTGKTSLISRFINGHFDPNYDSTIGVDFVNKSMCNKNGDRLSLQIWDTAGQERFRSLVPSYIRNTHVVCLTFDLSSTETFENIKFWYRQIAETNHQNMKKLKIMLIGNKVDLEADRKVSREEMAELQRELNIDWMMEASAKTGHHVEDLFRKIGNAVPTERNAAKGKKGKYQIVDMDKKIRSQSNNTTPCC